VRVFSLPLDIRYSNRIISALRYIVISGLYDGTIRSHIIS